MKHSRRTFLIGAAATAGATSFLPYAAMAQDGMSDTFSTDAGDVTVHPVSHASFVMETPAGVIYSDPVGDPAMYADYPAPDLILLTHEHGDHFNVNTLQGLVGDNTQLISNPAVYGMLPEELQARTTRIGNGELAEWAGVTIDAIPAYNTTEDRLMFHPEGRDNGYVLHLDGFTVYISGDTEDTPEMRALEGIDLAFICMNLPYTMTAEQAASAVQEFQPTYVYPYHYGGDGEGSQDPAKFAELAGDATETKMGAWY
ncbi:MBL fold metallo-hydrolase [Pseudoroseicyclus sp. H15]